MIANVAREALANIIGSFAISLASLETYDGPLKNKDAISKAHGIGKATTDAVNGYSEAGWQADNFLLCISKVIRLIFNSMLRHKKFCAIQKQNRYYITNS